MAVETIIKPTKENVINYYIINNNTMADACEFFQMSKATFSRLLRSYDIHKDQQKINENMARGNDNPMRRNDVKEKQKQTMMARYGCINPSQNKKFKDKRMNTMIKRYGVKNALQNHCFVEKMQQTNISKYGCKSPAQNELVKQKIKNTNLERYGCECTLQNPEIQNKARQSMIAKYGVLKYAQQDIPLESIDIYNNKDKLKEFILKYGDRPTSKQIAEDLKISIVTLDRYLTNFKLWQYVDLYSSHPEQEIYNFLQSIGVKNILRRDKSIAGIELDLYCPDYQIAIEFNGTYWHCDINKKKNYHFDKSKIACNKNIRLIHIYEYEWNDTNKRPIVESLLKIAFGKVQEKIYARKCEIREISNQDAKIFNDQNHLQHHRNAQITYGLFYKNELVQLMSFSKTKYNKNIKKDNEWEIIRGCPGSNNIVIGGVSKLFNHFIKNYTPSKIFSYCDFNKFNGKGYEAIGMRFSGYTGPDMKWVLSDMSVIDRNPRKHKELKNQAKAKIWGAGSKKYTWER